MTAFPSTAVHDDGIDGNGAMSTTMGKDGLDGRWTLETGNSCNCTKMAKSVLSCSGGLPGKEKGEGDEAWMLMEKESGEQVTSVLSAEL